VECTCCSSYEVSIYRRITVQAGLGINLRPYWKKQKKLVAGVKRSSTTKTDMKTSGTE
jgi:hypothetical protein